MTVAASPRRGKAGVSATVAPSKRRGPAAILAVTEACRRMRASIRAREEAAATANVGARTLEGRCQDRAVTTRLVGRCPHSGTTGIYVRPARRLRCPSPCRQREWRWGGGRGSSAPCRRAWLCAGRRGTRRSVPRRSTPRSSMVVTNVCLSMCGCIRGSRTPAAVGRWRSRRVAAWRCIRAPRVLRRIGPESRPSTARSTARLTAGGSGTRATLLSLTTRSTRWPCSSPRAPTRPERWAGGTDSARECSSTPSMTQVR
jgi:hypothetical protein